MDTTLQEGNFVAYEYRDVVVRRDMEALCADSFPSFGWKLENRSHSLGAGNISLKFKRNRRVSNRAELTRLQREYESHMDDIVKLENSKLIVPSAVAYGVGLVGAVFMALALYGYLQDMKMMCAILSVPAFVCWIVPYFAYTVLKQRKTEELVPIIDQKYDAIYEICEKADKLVHYA